MRNGELTGAGKVFGFTLRQFFKGKANIITLVILMLASMVSVPVMTVLGGGEETQEGVFHTLYVWDETGLSVDFTPLGLEVVAAVTELPQTLSEGEAEAHLYLDGDGYHVAVRGGVDEEPQGLAAEIAACVDTARFSALEATPEQLARLTAGHQSGVNTVSDYLDTVRIDFADAFAVQYVYAILIMILTLFSGVYIVHAVLEEKASRLVETLMVSVKPMALIVGKILAVMAYMFGVLIAMMGAMALSYFVTGLFLPVTSPLGMIENAGVSLSGMHIGAGTVVIALVSLLLGYLTFSILGGLFGTACSTMEEMESANFSLVVVVMAGYLISCVTAGMGSRIVGIVVSILPITSVFCAPVQYVYGTISFGTLCISWLVQLAVVILLARFCGKIYHDLLLYRGERMKLGAMLALGKSKKGGGVS